MNAADAALGVTCGNCRQKTAAPGSMPGAAAVFPRQSTGGPMRLYGPRPVTRLQTEKASRRPGSSSRAHRTWYAVARHTGCRLRYGTTSASGVLAHSLFWYPLPHEDDAVLLGQRLIVERRKPIG